MDNIRGADKVKYDQALNIAEEVGAKLFPYVDKIRVAGSIRRKKAEPNDIELVCIPKTVKVDDGLFDKKSIRHPNFAAQVRLYEIVKGNPDTGKYVQCVHPTGIKIDLFITNRNDWGRIFAIRTGSSEFSQYFAARWVKWGYKGTSAGLMHVESSEIMNLPTEKAFFDLLGLPVVPPEKRNQFGLP